MAIYKCTKCLAFQTDVMLKSKEEGLATSKWRSKQQLLPSIIFSTCCFCNEVTPLQFQIRCSVVYCNAGMVGLVSPPPPPVQRLSADVYLLCISSEKEYHNSTTNLFSLDTYQYQILISHLMEFKKHSRIAVVQGASSQNKLQSKSLVSQRKTLKQTLSCFQGVEAIQNAPIVPVTQRGDAQFVNWDKICQFIYEQGKAAYDAKQSVRCASAPLIATIIDCGWKPPSTGSIDDMVGSYVDLQVRSGSIKQGSKLLVSSSTLLRKAPAFLQTDVIDIKCMNSEEIGIICKEATVAGMFRVQTRLDPTFGSRHTLEGIIVTNEESQNHVQVSTKFRLEFWLLNNTLLALGPLHPKYSSLKVNQRIVLLGASVHMALITNISKESADGSALFRRHGIMEVEASYPVSHYVGEELIIQKTANKAWIGFAKVLTVESAL